MLCVEAQNYRRMPKNHQLSLVPPGSPLDAFSTAQDATQSIEGRPRRMGSTKYLT